MNGSLGNGSGENFASDGKLGDGAKSIVIAVYLRFVCVLMFLMPKAAKLILGAFSIEIEVYLLLAHFAADGIG